MRITGGIFGGRTLATPRDDRVRPTSDKVRQAVFNILLHNDFGRAFTLEGVRAVDLFAGTGAMGVEALSHGAAFCLFVDDTAESRALIRQNIEALGLTGASKIWRRDATRLGAMSPGAGGPFGLVILDPPYRKSLIPPALAGLRQSGWLAERAVLVVETAEDETRPQTEGLEVLDKRVYGDTRVFFLGY
ncbi:MAG: 16S rRNA (guanine(966)-N(2))-methyltransferase RsmD [Alphaproteobacteria bacterium]|nr:16S rRNA (guanine(966)-N(2))-methyltransferase RsmD [Alphaproteobacteria bacterium]